MIPYKTIIFNNFSENMSSLGIFPKGLKIAVAVSGGVDSMYLAFLTKQWATQNGLKMEAIIVDHKLREESSQEAYQVSIILKSLGINSTILTMQALQIKSSLQEKARRERYNLLQNYCFNNDIPYLLIAHHLDDQMETLLFREGKGLNVLGGSGMGAKLLLEKVIILRPLLNFTKEQIMNSAIANNMKWVEDPSNKNTKYHRVKIRKDLAYMHNKAEIIQRLNINIQKRLQIEQNLINLIVKTVRISSLGLLSIDLELYKEYEHIFQVLILRMCLKFIGGDYYQVSFSKAEKLLSKLLNEDRRKISLGKCIIKTDRNNIFIFKEKGRINKDCQLISNNKFYWDYRIILQDSYSNLDVANVQDIQEYMLILNIEDTKSKDFLYTLPKVSLENKKTLKFKARNPLFSNYFTKM